MEQDDSTTEGLKKVMESPAFEKLTKGLCEMGNMNNPCFGDQMVSVMDKVKTVLTESDFFEDMKNTTQNLKNSEAPASSLMNVFASFANKLGCGIDIEKMKPLFQIMDKAIPLIKSEEEKEEEESSSQIITSRDSKTPELESLAESLSKPQ